MEAFSELSGGPTVAAFLIVLGALAVLEVMRAARGTAAAVVLRRTLIVLAAALVAVAATRPIVLAS